MATRQVGARGHRTLLAHAVTVLYFAVVVWVSATACGPNVQSRGYAILATTTSLQSSGLLDVLLPAFKDEKGSEIRVLLAGSGRALDMLRRGDADIVISHAPAAEARALAAEPSWVYHKLMFNTFVLVGPQDDPAGVRTAGSASEGMRRIAQSTARFVSRGDESGTHERERRLWELAGSIPHGTRLLVSGAGMSSTLRQASATSAYTLSDKPTFLRMASSIDLVLLFEGDPELLNTYAVIVSGAVAEKEGAAVQFAEWLLHGGGRVVIATYQVAGQRAFEMWPPGRPATDPRALPDSR